MIRKLNLFLWFLARPRLYPHVLYLFRKKLLLSDSDHGESRLSTQRWCADNAIGTADAIGKLTGCLPDRAFESTCPEEIERASDVAARAPKEFGGSGNLDLLYWLAEHIEATRVIETGVALGWSSLALLSSLRKRGGTQLVSTDMPTPLTKRKDRAFVGCVVPDDWRSHWTLLANADRQSLPKAIEKLATIDMCHYDSDKSYSGRMWAYPLLFHAIRPGGFFISDDIGDNSAFREFAESTGQPPIIVERDGKFVGIITKHAS